MAKNDDFLISYFPKGRKIRQMGKIWHFYLKKTSIDFELYLCFYPSLMFRQGLSKRKMFELRYPQTWHAFHNCLYECYDVLRLYQGLSSHESQNKTVKYVHTAHRVIYLLNNLIVRLYECVYDRHHWINVCPVFHGFILILFIKG